MCVADTYVLEISWIKYWIYIIKIYHNIINNIMLKKDKPYLGSYEDAPAFIRKNKYLLTGYRINYSSIKLATCNLFDQS